MYTGVVNYLMHDWMGSSPNLQKILELHVGEKLLYWVIVLMVSDAFAKCIFKST